MNPRVLGRRAVDGQRGTGSSLAVGGEHDAATDCAATGVTTRGSVADRLLASAAAFAGMAVAAYRDEDWPLFYIHLATALEHLVKGALAHANPAYIADARSFDALLHLTGRGDRASKPEFVEAAKTISVGEAMERAARLVDGFSARSSLIGALLDRRNAVIHAGTAVTGEEAHIIGDVARQAASLLQFVERTPGQLWGEDEAFVDRLAARRATEIEAAYARRLEAARVRFGALAKRLDESTMTAYLASREATRPADDYSAFPFECPACAHLGMLEGDPEPDWEPDYDYDGYESYVSGVYVARIRLSASQFSCNVCGLSLNREELVAAGMSAGQFGEDDFDLSEASDYFQALERDDAPDW